MSVAAVMAPLVYALLVLFQLGSWNGAQWWLNDILTLRRAFYAELLHNLPAEQRKTIIVGGSATLFGVDSGAIERTTGEPTLNFGLHAGLDIDLLLAQASDFIDANDRVVLPLEFDHYSRPSVTDLSAESFLAFLYPFAGAIPVSRLVPIALATQPASAMQGVADHLGALVTGHPAGKWRSAAALLEDWRQIQAAGGAAGPEHNPYDYSTMNAHGDKALILETPASDQHSVGTLITPSSAALTPYAAEALTSWKQTLANRGAGMLLTWPVIIEDDSGTIFQAGYWASLIALARAADAIGMPLHCDPINAIVPVQYRYDTVYHTNAKGQAIYSAGLAACLPGIETNVFDWKNANPNEMAARAKARIAALKQPPDPLVFGYERNIRQLGALHDAIEAEHAISGRYPAALPPFDPDVSVVEVDTAPFQPVYRSDGQNYKLVSPGSDECFAVSEGWPELIDPIQTKGEACAYGYWTAGAANW
ncbi:hypothetical protein SAMN02745157_3435 [Kaistia soli DSM 19436]|uniref:Uncharacterized protein n=2 Tax=Kaistia TaxID=166953 RepID=A0A1M5GJX0_9HYPH|nr:hypothetical protein SAMN02745157_3435 [Kaistia soli DSM 19436]